MYEKGCNGVNQSSLRISNVLLVFYLKLMNLNAFDFRSVHSAGVQMIYFSLPLTSTVRLPLRSFGGGANDLLFVALSPHSYCSTCCE